MMVAYLALLVCLSCAHAVEFEQGVSVVRKDRKERSSHLPALETGHSLLQVATRAGTTSSEHAAREREHDPVPLFRWLAERKEREERAEQRQSEWRERRGEWGAPSISLCGKGEANLGGSSADSKIMSRAMKSLCSPERRGMMKAWVDPRFKGNFQRLYSNGTNWIDEAFINYFSAPSESSAFAKETELLVESVHEFSEKPIVVFDFGEEPCKVPHWTSERFPRLVLLRAKPIQEGVSFNFNKIRAMLLAKARTGVVVDSDQFVFRGADQMFERTRQEGGADYPYPIMPVHWMSRDDGDALGYRVYKFKCPDCPKRTMRWGHAHPTFTYHALPFLGDLLAGELDNPRHVLDTTVNVPEDEDALNVGLWDVGATKQWCKFDVPWPSLFETYARLDADNLEGCCNYKDDKWYPEGVPLMFFTAHAAKDTDQARRIMAQLRKLKADSPQVFHAGSFYDKTSDVPGPLPCLM
mmetsp:Transcript_71220/g.180303  ORF Transcript_71220/g.180303 Transcript_71220/m.180303 type:complete len:468 (-) Transcript_71220:26-1429(-)